MPYYAYIDLQDKVKSPNNTFDPSIIKTIAKKYRKVDKPILKVMYDAKTDKFREMTSDEIATRDNENKHNSALSAHLFTKLSIRRALRELNQEVVLDGLLSESELFSKEWNDAQEIDLNDDTTKQALEQLNIDIDTIKLKIAGV